MIKLSHSSANVYMECGQKYKLHYIDKIRQVAQNSPLVFGSTVDKALEAALKQFPSTDQLPILKIFNDEWANFLNVEVKYSKADHELDQDPWTSLGLKGQLIIKAFFRDILPNIEKVYNTQDEIALENTNGDKITGFADAVLKWKGHSEPIIFDFKTASRKYEDNAVKESPQLSLYKHALNEKYKTNKAGYIVFIKTVDKGITKYCPTCDFETNNTRLKDCPNIMVNGQRCHGEFEVTSNPFVKTQLLIDTIDETFENNTLESFDNITTMIQSQAFEANEKSCWGKYGPCQYINYCKHGSMDGLTIKK